MREHLFKAKSKDNGEWVEGFIYEHSPPLVCLSTDPVDPSRWFIVQTGFADWGMIRPVEFIEVDPDTICEWTGEYDKNYIKIYENDIVKMPAYSRGFINSVVYFEKGKFAVNGSHYNFKDLCPKSKEVVGNIFDNIEKLGEKYGNS